MAVKAACSPAPAATNDDAGVGRLPRNCAGRDRSPTDGPGASRGVAIIDPSRRHGAYDAIAPSRSRPRASSSPLQDFSNSFRYVATRCRRSTAFARGCNIAHSSASKRFSARIESWAEFDAATASDHDHGARRRRDRQLPWQSGVSSRVLTPQILGRYLS